MTGAARTRAAAIALVVSLAGCTRGSSVIGGPFAGFGGGSPWLGYAHDAQHTALDGAVSQPISRIHWQTPVDLFPQYSNGELLAHYGSPVITPADTAIVPVKTGPTDGFRVEAHNAANGALIWQFASDYRLPAHNWTPSFNPSLTMQDRLYFPGSGGKLFYRDNPDSAQGAPQLAVFYGVGAYNANKAAFDNTVIIDTPVTTDAHGNAYFGFLVTGANPGNRQRHRPSGLNRQRYVGERHCGLRRRIDDASRDELRSG